MLVPPNNMSNLDHKQRYALDIVGDEMRLHDTFSQAKVLTLPYSEKQRDSAITLCTMLNAFWSEINDLRAKAEANK